MPARCLTTLLVLLFLFIFNQPSQAAVINFDFLPDGTRVENSPPTPISDQYQVYGVLFSAISRNGSVIAPVAYGPVAHEYTSEPNILISSEQDPWNPIMMDFITPFNGSVRIALISVGDSLVTVSALGLDLTTVIDSVSVTNPDTDRGIGNINWITLSGNNISRVLFDTTIPWYHDGWGIDDVGLAPASVVPEPASLSLLGLGLLRLVLKRRKTA